MKASLAAAAAAFGFAVSVSGQYFSEGWKPGQAVSKAATGYTSATSVYSPQNTDTSGGQQATTESKGLSSLLDLTNLLQTGPAKAFFGSIGVNITEKIALAQEQTKIWDPRIPLITDDNYESMIVEEKFETLEEETNRVWFFVMYEFVTHGSRNKLTVSHLL